MKISPGIEIEDFGEGNERDVLDVPTNYKTDCIIVLSSHKSVKPRPMLTVHHPGNWGSADYGGESRTLNSAYGSLMKEIFIGMKKYAEKEGLEWEITIEADHHGPTGKVPIIFAEIGSSEKEWKNKKAAKVVALAVRDVLEKKVEYPCFFAVGGGHYQDKICRILEDTEWCVGHILPKYRIKDLDEEMFKQAVEKNTEKIEKVMVDKECNRWQKDKIGQFCKKYGLEIEEY